MTTPTPHPSELLPHTGAMVLIDSVCEWGPEHIVCRAQSHTAADNPLRGNEHLSIYCGVEYAAQAMAAHAKLVADKQESPRKGFLATASRVVAHADRLDAIQAPLDIHATQIANNGDSSLYEFRIEANAELLLEGQLMVVKQ